MVARRRLIVFSGAGLSADSGLATFRAADGTWANHRVDQVCDIRTWKQNFPLVHAFYNARRQALSGVQPNPMHRLLVSWEDRFSAELITQNVDDLLESAGARSVMHVHGHLREMACQACGRIWDLGHAAWDHDVDRCTCGSRKGVKPNVVFFHESAPLYRPMYKALTGLGPRDVLVVIGTDGAVVPIGALAAETPARKLLNTLGPVAPGAWHPGMVTEAQFDHLVYRPAAEAVEEVDRIVSGWMSED